MLAFTLVRRARKPVHDFAGWLRPIGKRLVAPFLPFPGSVDDGAETFAGFQAGQHGLQRLGGVGFPAGRQWHVRQFSGLFRAHAEVLDEITSHRLPILDALRLGQDDDALRAHFSIICVPQTGRDRLSNGLFARVLLPSVTENLCQSCFERIADQLLLPAELEVEFQTLFRSRLSASLVQRLERATNAAPRHGRLGLQLLENLLAFILVQRTAFSDHYFQVVQFFEHPPLLR